MHGGASTDPRTVEGLQRIAEARSLRKALQALGEDQCRLLELVK
jgi:hypothetical protein